MTELKQVKIDKDAILDGIRYPAGAILSITEEALAVAYRDAAKADIRANIAAQAGDAETLFGTTADLAHLLLVKYSELLVALRDAKSLEELRAAAGKQAQVFEDFAARVRDGEIKLPYQLDGESEVLREVVTRAQATTVAFEGGMAENPAVAFSPSEDLKDEVPGERYVSPDAHRPH